MTRSLSEKYPDGYLRLEEAGYKGVCRMLEIFTTPGRMATALGFDKSGGAVGKWVNGQNMPSRQSELAAVAWVKERNAEAEASVSGQLVGTPTPIEQQMPASQPEQLELTASSGDAIWIVLGPPEKLRKLKRMAEIMGITVEDAA